MGDEVTEKVNNAAQATADGLQAELERCTKAELIALIRSRAFYVGPKDVRRARGEVLYNRGVRLTEKALAMMDEAKGSLAPDHRARWVRASRMFDRSMDMRNRGARLQGLA